MHVYVCIYIFGKIYLIFSLSLLFQPSPEGMYLLILKREEVRKRETEKNISWFLPDWGSTLHVPWLEMEPQPFGAQKILQPTGAPPQGHLILFNANIPYFGNAIIYEQGIGVVTLLLISCLLLSSLFI